MRLQYWGGTPVSTRNPGAPLLLTLVQGDGQSVGAGLPVPILPAVRVTNNYGEPVAGFAVTFSGDGVITGGSAITDAVGVATVGSWTVVPGVNTLTATGVGLLGSPVVFTATGQSINLDDTPLDVILRRPWRQANGLYRPASDELIVPSGGGGGARTPLFASNWSNSTGTSSTALRDGTNWDDEAGGTNPLSVVASAGRFPTTNDLQSNHQTADDYYWCQEYALRGALSNGQFVAIRLGLYHAVPDGAGSQGWAASHFVEAAAVSGGGSDSANKWELLMGSAGDGTFPFAVGLNGVAFPYNYLSMGSAGGGDPAHLNKNTLYWIELKFTRTGTNQYTCEMRVRNSAGTILFSTGDSLNNIYGWGGAAFGSGNNTGLAIADAAVVKLRVGKNGGFGAGVFAAIHWGGAAACDDDWVGPWGSLTTDV